MKTLLIAAATLAVAIPLATPAHASTLQVTSGSGQRAITLGNFGGAAGQSFTAQDTVLNSVGFQFEGLNPATAGSAYVLSLVAGEALTGTALVTRTFTLPTSIDSRAPVWFDIDIGATAVTLGLRYTAVLTSADTRNGLVLGPDINLFTGVPVAGDAYAGGRALFATVPYPNCDNTAASACDLNFRVTGTTATAAVPEPSSWAMMIGGFGVVGGALRRRRAPLATA